jgi:D-cysteine desulfhydrase
MIDDPPLRLFAHYPALAEALARQPLVSRPTPVRPMGRLGERLGLGELWIKDDSGGPPVGGNKARKLEFLVADALRRDRRSLVTVGYYGTNHGLATTLAGRQAGLDVEVVVLREVATDHVRDTLVRCAALGATLHHAGGEVQSVAVIARVLASAALAGRRPCWIPPGGSSPLGTLGYVEAGLELAWQVSRGDLPEPSCVYVPLGSAGTSAGIALGLSLAGMRTEVRAVRVVSPRMASTRRTARLARAAWRQMRALDPSIERRPPPLELRAVGGFEGPGYGTETPEALDAMALARELEDLPLEVTYTGRALAFLVHDAGEGGIDGPVVLWNTFHPRGAMPAGAPHWSALPRPLHAVYR